MVGGPHVCGACAEPALHLQLTHLTESPQACEEAIPLSHFSAEEIRPREVKSLALNHTACEMKRWG